MMMVVGKKQVGESWHPKLMNQTQLKLRQLNPIRATAIPTARKLCGRRRQPQHLFAQGRYPVCYQNTSFYFLSRTRSELRGRHDRRTMDVLLTNQITLAVIC